MTKKLISRTELAAMCGVSAAAITKACGAALRDAVVGKRVDVKHPIVVEYIEKKTRAATEKLVKPAATGIDPLYEDALVFFRDSGKCSTTSLQREFRIGWRRASAIVATLKANNVDLSAPEPKPVKTTHVRGTEAAKNTRKSVAAAALTEKLTTVQDDTNGIIEIPEDIQMFADMSLRELIRRFGTDTAFVDWLRATKEIEAINEKRLKNAITEGKLISRELVKNAIINKIDAVFTQMLTDGASTIAMEAAAIVKSGGDEKRVKRVIEDRLGSYIRPAKVKMAGALRDA